MTIQTPLQLVITIGIIALGTFLIRALPFFLFPAGKKRRALLPTSAQRSRALRSQCSSFTVLKMSLYFPVLMDCRSSSVPCSSLSSTNGGTTCCSPSSAARFYTCCSCSSFFRYSRKFCKKECALAHSASAAASFFLKIVFSSSAGIGLPFFRRFCLHPVQRHCCRVRL